jgi:GT2 family glycosyltransferase
VRASIIIPLYNRWDLTEACVRALHKTVPLNHEIILVDNASTDFTAKAIVDVRNPINRGFAVACNQGAEHASGDVLVFLNNDTQPTPGWLEHLLYAVGSGAMIAGPLLVYPTGETQSAGIGIDFAEPPGREAVNRQGDHPRSEQVDAVTGACLAIRRTDFEMLGGFDEGYWNGYEDVDLCLTARAAGGTVVYEPASVVIHHESQSGPERWTGVAANVARLRDKWEHHAWQ